MKKLFSLLIITLAVFFVPTATQVKAEAVIVCSMYIDEDGCVMRRCDICNGPQHCYYTIEEVRCPGGSER